MGFRELGPAKLTTAASDLDSPDRIILAQTPPAQPKNASKTGLLDLARLSVHLNSDVGDSWELGATYLAVWETVFQLSSTSLASWLIGRLSRHPAGQPGV